MTQNYHLAQINIARGLATLDSPVMKGFFDQLDPINSLAEASQGFVWRLQDDGDDATTPNAFDDELIIVNMSVWSSFASLKNYVYSGDHLTILKQKKQGSKKSGGQPWHFGGFLKEQYPIFKRVKKHWNASGFMGQHPGHSLLVNLNQHQQKGAPDKRHHWIRLQSCTVLQSVIISPC